MSDFVISLVRTYVPLGVAWLVSAGLLPQDQSTAAVAAVTAAVSAVYYLVVRALESRWPIFGWLLGKATPAGTPTYK